MALTDFKDFPRLGRLLGIDWGAVRLGLAVSTPDQAFVFESSQLANSTDHIAITEIIKIVESEKIVGIVLGLPLRGDGTDSGTTRMVRNFADALVAAVDIPIIFMEENLTSVEAAERVDIKKQKANLDSQSAVIILENAIAMIKRQI